MPGSARGVATLRSDAARNRRLLLETARRLFGSRGLDVPFDEIAQQAGLGNATLYRHFPSRCDLIAAVFAETLQEVVDACERALDNPDPWEGLASHVTHLCQLQAEDRGLADLLTTRMSAVPELGQLRARAFDLLVRLADRAKDDGTLRADFQPEDLMLLLMANAGLIDRTADLAPGAWKRLVAYTLDGLRHNTHLTPAPASPGLAAMRAAMTGEPAGVGAPTPAKS